ncbi:hypothetical protein AX16_010544 [Volvariella volvacea WC 439]|nr:hypothetical protein AX16_010544 [Volvariella volvacea WC 439]
MLSDMEESREDMRLILALGFNSIYQSRRALIRSCQWPSEGTVGHIVMLAQGQFIYVLTILQWLDDDDGDPVERLVNIFKTSSDSRARAFAPLDRLYDLILTNACSKEASNLVLPRLLLIAGPRPVHHLSFLGDLLGKGRNHLQIVLQPLHSIIRVPDDECDDIESYHTSFIEYLHDASRSGSYFIFDPKITNFLLPKTIPPADVDKAVQKCYPTLWLEIYAFIPEDAILFTPDLQTALARMNAKHWLRKYLLFGGFNHDEINKKYNKFWEWLMRCLPEDQKHRLNDNFPKDLFPPPSGDYQQHWLRHWAKDFESGLLLSEEVAILLRIFFVFAIAKSVPSNRRLEEPPHSLSTLFQNSDFNELPSLVAIMDSMFIPMDLLFFYAVSSIYADFVQMTDSGNWWRSIRDLQLVVEINRRTLMLLRGFVRFVFLPRKRDSAYPRDLLNEQLSLFIKNHPNKHFGNAAPRGSPQLLETPRNH